MRKLGLVLCLVLLSACHFKPETPPQKSAGSPVVTLKEASFADLKNFDRDSLTDFLPAFEKNCTRLSKNPNDLAKSEIKIDSKSYLEICRRFEKQDLKSTAQIRKFLKTNFQPFLVLADGRFEGKFTSYYEAEIKASRLNHGQYRYPIYGRPADLVEIQLNMFDPSLPKKRLLGRVENSKLIPYYTRAEIETGGLEAPVILWGDDPVDIFLMQIQGSAVANLDDGSSVRIRYADNNGHDFVGIGSILLKKGLLKQGQASMDKIRDWLKENPELAQANMNENKRFVFHQISDADGPVGAFGVSLTAGRSLAVDKQYIPLGSLLWLETDGPNEKIRKLVMAQDIGGAIKGAVRGDYFWGHGEQALLKAGKMNEKGKYYILLPRSAAQIRLLRSKAQ